jgi:transposase
MRQTIGVDISKDHLDVHSLPIGEYAQFENTTLGHKRFSKWLSGRDLNLIVFEPTGAYHKTFQRTMHTKGFPLNKVNPLHARRFAQAAGILTKTDRVDAAMLARMGMALELVPQEVVAEDIQVLGKLYTAKRGLMKDRTAALNRQKLLSHPILKRQCAARLRQIRHQMAKIDAEVKHLVEAADHHKQRFDILVSIPGISTTTAISLIVERQIVYSGCSRYAQTIALYACIGSNPIQS